MHVYQDVIIGETSYTLSTEGHCDLIPCTGHWGPVYSRALGCFSCPSCGDETNKGANDLKHA